MVDTVCNEAMNYGYITSPLDAIPQGYHDNLTDLIPSLGLLLKSFFYFALLNRKSEFILLSIINSYTVKTDWNIW
jgi:hypothetical protein